MNVPRAIRGLIAAAMPMACGHVAPPPETKLAAVDASAMSVDAGNGGDAADARDAAATSVSAAHWQAIVTGRLAIGGAAWTEGGRAVIATATDIWTIDPLKPARARRTPLSTPLGEFTSIAAREDSNVVAVSLGDGSVDVFVDAALARTLPPMAKGLYAVRVALTPDGRSLVASADASRGRTFTRIYDLATWTSKPAKKPELVPAKPALPYRTPRADKAFALIFDSGVQIIETSGRVRLAWGTEKQTMHPPARLTRRPDGFELAPPEAIAATSACGPDPVLMDARDGSTTYTVQADWLMGVCVCTNDGCKLTWLKEPPPGPASEPLLHEVVIGVGSGGAFVSKTTADDESKNVVTLHPASTLAATPARSVRTTVGAMHCSPLQVAFSGERIFAMCNDADAVTLAELSPKNLAPLARRVTPPLSCYANVLGVLGAKLFLGCQASSDGDLYDPAWIGDPTKGADGHLFIWPTVGIFQRADGTIEISGKTEDAEREVQCFDGENLAPFAACKDAVLAKD